MSEKVVCLVFIQSIGVIMMQRVPLIKFQLNKTWGADGKPWLTAHEKAGRGMVHGKSRDYCVYWMVGWVIG